MQLVLVVEVLVMLNDVPLGGSVESTLFSINPETVESIEFTNRINVLYGSFGGSGVLSIYTKQGVTEENLKVAPNFKAIKIAGYSSFRKFRFPSYEDRDKDSSKADYRSTIYWNPDIVADIKTGMASISFFAADLPGKYRIIAEGVLKNGEPMRCVYFVTVDND